MFKGDNFECFGLFTIDYWTYLTTLSFGFCEIIVVYIKLCITPTILRLWLLLTSSYLFVFTDGNLAEVCRLSPQRRSPVLSRKNRESKFFPLSDTLCNAFHVFPEFWKTDPHATPINSDGWYDPRGVFLMMAYTGRLRPKGVPFLVFGYIIG